jgi:hypothetical protein
VDDGYSPVAERHLGGTLSYSQPMQNARLVIAILALSLGVAACGSSTSLPSTDHSACIALHEWANDFGNASIRPTATAYPALFTQLKTSAQNAQSQILRAVAEDLERGDPIPAQQGRDATTQCLALGVNVGASKPSTATG